MNDLAWKSLIVGGAALGIFLLAWGSLNALASLLRRTALARRTSLLHRLQALRALPPTAQAHGFYIPVPVTLAVGLGALGAFLARDLIVSPYLLAMGLAAGYFVHRWGARPPELGKPVEQLIAAFRGQFALQPTKFTALAETVAVLPEGPVKSAVEQAVARYRVAQDDPLLPLRDLHDAMLARFVAVLDQVERADKDATLRTLRGLEERVRAQRRLREQVASTLRTLRNTVRFLAGVNVVLAVGLWLAPLMRAYFILDLVGRLVYIGVTLGAALGVAYFTLETRALEEQAV